MKIKTPKLLGSTNDALFSVERKESLIFSRAPQNKTFPLLMVTFFVYQGSEKGCSSIGRVRSLPITEQMELINHAWFLKSVFYFPNLLWKDCWAKIFRHARSEPEYTIQAKFQCFHISVLWAKLLFFTSWLRENLVCEVMLWEMLPKTDMKITITAKIKKKNKKKTFTVFFWNRGFLFQNVGQTRKRTWIFSF